MERETVEVQTTWKASHRIEVPEGVNRDDFIDEINNASGPNSHEAFEQMTTANAELTDWDAR
jgi:hypothetical protein